MTETTETFKNLVMESYNLFYNFNVFIKRNHPYELEGRTQTEEEAKAIDDLSYEKVKKVIIHFDYEMVSSLENAKFIVDKLSKLI